MRIIVITLVVITILFILCLHFSEKFNTKQYITAIQWNPHWQCFGGDCCGGVAQNYIRDRLSKNDVDFFSVVALEVDSTDLPEYDIHHILPEPNVAQCGVDMVNIIYNSTKWKPISDTVQGCFINQSSQAPTIPGARPFVIQQFQNIATTTKIWVIGAHWPHPTDWGPDNYYGSPSYIQVALKGTGWVPSDKVLFMGDTNVNISDVSDKDIFNQMIPLSVGNIISAHVDDTKTCCNDTNGWLYNPDRVIANFGTPISTLVVPQTRLIPPECLYPSGSPPLTGWPDNKQADTVEEMHLPVEFTLVY